VRSSPVVTVTGSSGRVGAAIADALHSAGWTVTGIDRLPGRWTSVVGDLRERGARRAALDEAHAVVHTAALHAPHVGRVSDAEFRAVNVGATEALLDDAGRGTVRRFVYISSTSVYGYALVPSDEAVWVDERLRPRPRDVYDQTKLAAEGVVAGSPLAPVTLRIARCFPEPMPRWATHLLHRAVALADVAQGTVRAVQQTVTGTFNIAGPYPFTRADSGAVYGDAARMIAERAPEVAAAFRERGWPLPLTLDRVYDSGAAATALGYRPVHDALGLLHGRRKGYG
jgi:nucleoside-diphosphate-sugar epimerase